MPVTSVIVECDPDGVERVLERLESRPGVSVFGSQGSKIVAVIEGEEAAAIAAVVDELNGLPSVIGVYPVYAGGYE